MLARPLVTSLAASILALQVGGQAPTVKRGEYVNFESPQVKPIAVAKLDDVGGGPACSYLLVCNTPDNSVEVYDIRGPNRNAPQFRARIPVGLEPVSVVFHSFDDPDKQMMYVVNWLGDSVTYVELTHDNESVPSFTYNVVREVVVTDPRATQSGNSWRCDDEPMHAAVVDRPGTAGRWLIVSKRSASSYAALDPITGAFLAARSGSGSCAADSGRNVIMTDNAQWPVGTVPPESSPELLALKEPHTVAARPNTDEFYVLGHQGGGSKRAGGFTPFDFDVWGVDLNGGACAPTSFRRITGLGTTNFNMAFDLEGDFLYVVGTEALNDLVGNQELLGTGAATGFVKTMLWKVNIANPIAPTQSVDLNGGATPPPSLAHVTDLEIYRPAGQSVDYACLAGFNSDRFGVVDLTTFAIQRCDVESPPDADNASGPRGIAVLRTTSAANDRAYLLDRLDNSVTVIDPRAGVAAPTFVSKFGLQVDPTPDYVRRGQRFLYSTTFSANGFVGCASCHVDGRSDQLLWLLDGGDGPIPPVPPGVPKALEIAGPAVSDPAFHDEVYVAGSFPEGEPIEGADAGKGPMITQSLQGLVSFEVDGTLFNGGTGNTFDDLVSNAPYHWRGDKDSFTDFNEAFHNLQGGNEVSATEMEQFEKFVNSIHYPPNPLQNRTRTYDGTFGNPDTFLDAEGPLGGLKLFHIMPTPEVAVGLDEPFGGRSCVQCHFLPDASNNRITFGPAGRDFSPQDRQPLETASLRGLGQKEARLALTPDVHDSTDRDLRPARCGDLGMGHEGRSGLSRSEFLEAIVGPTPVLAGLLTTINEFVREIDHGIAPIVGRTVTIDSPSADTAPLAELEQQAKEANCGIAVYAKLGDDAPYQQLGYWYRFTGCEPKYKQVGASTEWMRNELLNLRNTTGGILIFRATPLGSERRIASILGTTSGEPPPSVAPSDVRIIGTTPNTAYEGIPEMTRNWILQPPCPAPGCDDPKLFAWTGPTTDPFTGGVLSDPLSLRIVRNFQAALSTWDVEVRHEMPRRLQVVGSNLHQGAWIRLHLTDGAGERLLTMQIHPTDKFHAPNERIWETEVEFDPTSLYSLILGGPGNSAVRSIIDLDVVPTSPAPSPAWLALDARNAGTMAWSAQSLTQIPYPAASTTHCAVGE